MPVLTARRPLASMTTMKLSPTWLAAAVIAAAISVNGLTQNAPEPTAEARVVAVTPLVEGTPITVPTDASGAFRITGLAAGLYRVNLRQAGGGKSTQGATFGERVNRTRPGPSEPDEGETPTATVARHRGDLTTKAIILNVRARTAAPPTTSVSSTPAGGGQAASASYAKTKIDGGMPSRISMNVRVGRRVQPVDVDGDGVVVEVGPDGVLEGQLSAR